jgi:polyphosphate glucokinase
MDSGFGVDVGGSGIKGAPVDLATGELLRERVRIETPQPSTPEAVVAVVDKVLGDLADGVRIGMTLPSVVVGGTALTAANIDPSWVFTDVEALVRERTHHEVLVVNDADAAGVAEVRFGAAKGVRGTVLLLTLGTGIGSALFLDGRLVPNTELGHLELDGHDAEKRASDAARKRDDLSWAKWAKRLSAYIDHVDQLLRPDLVVLGGGVSKKSDQWLDLLEVRPPVRPAALLNDAGIVGAAVLAAEA